MRVTNFDSSVPGPQMIIRYRGYRPDVMLVDNNGEVVRKFNINTSPNNTGMEVVYWRGRDHPALLYNGGMLWKGNAALYADLGLPDEMGGEKMGWYHCIPANIEGDEREEMAIYNPWDDKVYLVASMPVDAQKYDGYHADPRQYNVRLMD